MYSQAGLDAYNAQPWFEQLRAFLGARTGFKLDGAAPVRVIAFRSAKEYEPYRLRPGASAHSIGAESREYIVLPSLASADSGLAAHEYAHVVLHTNRLNLPNWLAEGLADFFSTVRFSAGGSTIGGDLPRSQELRRGWMPLAQLVTAEDESTLFYAESWALTEMLAMTPQYAGRFSLLAGTLASGVPAPQAFAMVYAKSLPAIETDLRAWVERRRFPVIELPGVPRTATAIETAELSPFEARLLLADLVTAGGELDRAEREYRALEAERPGGAAIPAALGMIALRRGDLETARTEWGRAVAAGIDDPVLCFRYAVLAANAGLPETEIRPALERAIALRPDFDDARYPLALQEKNAGRAEAAVAQLRAMREVAPARRFAYWSALSDALNELGRKDEAKAAAKRAAEAATTPDERAHAAQLGYVADTEIAIRTARDPAGGTRMVTTRVPRGTQDWNPFIEAEDQIRKASGALRKIECGATMRFLIQTPEGPLWLAIPDPSRLLARNAPEEFTCGPQPGNPVTVEYTATGVLRGVEFVER